MCSGARDVEGRMLDPVCGMSVAPARARELGLTVEYRGTILGFCGPGCLSAFEADPSAYARATATVHAHGADAHGADAAGPDGAARGAVAIKPVIDEGMRRWYEACSCCLSDAHPEVKAALDAERAAAAQPLAGPGICEVAEAAI